MELVTIVFLLSLRSLKNYIAIEDIQIDGEGAQQLAVDIKFIIESIFTSEVLEHHDNEDFKQEFKEKILSLSELKKWQSMITALIEADLKKEDPTVILLKQQ
mmetsp:Transcript_10630/g.16211  ORF Transcript_10630/g.16211 Transcript_10630/m.16211 type:complete len:102 (+) Transcript_10630:169-474(+)